jgi:cytosine/adenosine deaminase-related metal-dependent hydrolase
MSSLASHAYRLTEVGEIEIGSRANLVLFDPDRPFAGIGFRATRSYP